MKPRQEFFARVNSVFAAESHINGMVIGTTHGSHRPDHVERADIFDLYTAIGQFIEQARADPSFAEHLPTGPVTETAHVAERDFVIEDLVQALGSVCRRIPVAREGDDARATCDAAIVRVKAWRREHPIVPIDAPTGPSASFAEARSAYETATPNPAPEKTVLVGAKMLAGLARAACSLETYRQRTDGDGNLWDDEMRIALETARKMGYAPPRAEPDWRDEVAKRKAEDAGTVVGHDGLARRGVEVDSDCPSNECQIRKMCTRKPCMRPEAMVAADPVCRGLQSTLDRLDGVEQTLLEAARAIIADRDTTIATLRAAQSGAQVAVGGIDKERRMMESLAGDRNAVEKAAQAVLGAREEPPPRLSVFTAARHLRTLTDEEILNRNGETWAGCPECGEPLGNHNTHVVYRIKPGQPVWEVRLNCASALKRKRDEEALAKDGKRTRPHIVDGEFQSDKYPTCPRGKVPLSVNDWTAQDLLWEYAQRRRVRDAEFSDDLEWALRQVDYDPAMGASRAQLLAGLARGATPATEDADRRVFKRDGEWWFCGSDGVPVQLTKGDGLAQAAAVCNPEFGDHPPQPCPPPPDAGPRLVEERRTAVALRLLDNIDAALRHENVPAARAWIKMLRDLGDAR